LRGRERGVRLELSRRSTYELGRFHEKGSSVLSLFRIEVRL